jgi:hypothetical protein
MRRRPPDSYFTLLAVLAFQAAVVALPGGPFFGAGSPVGIAIGVVLLILLGLGSRTAWWLTTGPAAIGAAGALVSPFVGPEGGPMTGIGRFDTAIWLVSIVAVFVVLVSPSMRGYGPAPRQRGRPGLALLVQGG